MIISDIKSSTLFHPESTDISTEHATIHDKTDISMNQEPEGICQKIMFFFFSSKNENMHHIFNNIFFHGEKIICANNYTIYKNACPKIQINDIL